MSDCLRSGLLSALVAASLGAHAAELPLWEAGAGIAAIDFPDYRGADERRTFVLPIPYFVYRGKFLKADRDNLRGQFFRNERVDLHLSVNASIPVDSSDNAARHGMPDLDPTLEIGPSLKLKLMRSSDRRAQLELRLPLRTVIATDLSHTRNVGWVFQPQLNLDLHDIMPGEGWNLGLAIGPLYGDKRFHNYYYGVAPAFAVPGRPAYTAESGYAGMQLIGALNKRYPSFWVGAFVRLDTLAGAIFEDSPLVRQKETLAAGFAVSWIFARSLQLGSPED